MTDWSLYKLHDLARQEHTGEEERELDRQIEEEENLFKFGALGVTLGAEKPDGWNLLPGMLPLKRVLIKSPHQGFF